MLSGARCVAIRVPSASSDSSGMLSGAVLVASSAGAAPGADAASPEGVLKTGGGNLESALSDVPLPRLPEVGFCPDFEDGSSLDLRREYAGSVDRLKGESEVSATKAIPAPRTSAQRIHAPQIVQGLALCPTA